jgi:hypothetical protein
MMEMEAHEVRLSSNIIGAPLTNALVFFAIVTIGCIYIAVGKLCGLKAGWVTFGPVAIMFAYAILIGTARSLRLRDDQSGDNLYYMGFLFTLTSLGVSLYQFNAFGAAELIVQNFGVAIASTIAGIALRIFFNQMRRDPIEVEASARAELAESSRKLRRELDNSVLEFSSFRRAAQQMILDGFAETKLKVDEVGEHLLSGLKDVTKRSAEPLEAASRHSADMTKTVTTSLESAAKHLSTETERLSSSASGVAVNLDGISSKLAAMRTPDQVIEIKLNPALQGISRAVNQFGKDADAQSVAINQAIEGVRAASADAASILTTFHNELAARDALTQETLQGANSAAKASADAAAASQARFDILIEKIDRVADSLVAATARENAGGAMPDRSL